MADTSGPSPWIVDVLQLNLDNLDVKQLPALSCGAAQTATLQGSLNVTGDLNVNAHDLFLAKPGDKSHGLGWYGSGKLFAGTNVDGPVLYGLSGGALGSPGQPGKLALRWDAYGTVSIEGTLKCASISSPMWKVTRVIADPGPLPLKKQFTSSGGTLIVFFSGSGRRGSVGLMTLQLSIDGQQPRTTTCWTNENDSHKTFPSVVEVFSGYGAGTHTLMIEAKDTTTDLNDFFHATVMELPF
jgi:hypothetical protein